MASYTNVRFLTSANSLGQLPPDQGVEVAFAGRSNAGKSSAINVIVQRNGLARVSRTPGRTRLLNFFEVGAGRRIVDLPGYGFAAAPEAERRTWAPMIDALRRRRALRGLILIVDSRRGVAPEDENLIAWARDPIDVFFLEIEGRGTLRFPGNREMRIGYGATNGRPYRSIAWLLIREGKIAPEAMSMRALRDWLNEHPEERQRVLHHNESFVFFRHSNSSPVGSLGVPLTPARSIATASAATVLSSLSMSRRSTRISSKVSCSDTSREPLPGRVRRGRVCWRWRTAERCFSTRSRRSRCMCR